MKILLAALLLASAALAPLAAGEPRDLVVLRAGEQKKACYIVTETDDGKLLYRDIPSQQDPKSYRLNELRSWEYVEMRDGHWPRAVEARDAGRYAEAADLFNALAGAGQKEWMKVYGAYHEGACWELLGDWAKAAEAFGRVVEVAPKHRLALDAQYRRGFALARAKNDAEANKIADELARIAKELRRAEADLRANAIRAVVAFNAGNGDAMRKAGRLASFNARDDRDAFLQFGTFFADAMRQLKMTRDAIGEYQRLLDAPEVGAAEKVALSLGLAKAQLESDKPAALVTLMRLDALPYGSVDQKTEARFLAGRLLAEDAKAALANAKDENATQFAKDLERTARVLLAAAAAADTATVPARDQARAELEAMGPDPDSPEAVKAAADAAKAPAAPAATPAAPVAADPEKPAADPKKPATGDQDLRDARDR